MASPSLSKLALEKTPVVLVGVGIGYGLGAELADCERDWDIWVAAGELLSAEAVAGIMAGPPLACEFIEG